MTAQGLEINYVKGLNNHLDFISTLSGSFINYQIPGKPSFDNKSTLLEATALINAKLLSDKYWVTPYLTTGIGGSKYKEYYGIFVPAGMGLQVNFWNDIFLLISAQYRVKLTENIDDHYYYSIGISGNIGKRKQTKTIASHQLPLMQNDSVIIKDSDGDGIIDDIDACPVQPGLAKFYGCPDSDGDGIPDKDDRCPGIPGILRLNGCPIPDTDKDGINDDIDKCPLVPGSVLYDGCPPPDRDHDGMNDNEDKCPDLAGTLENKGCPIIKQDLVHLFDSISKFILFETGSYKLLSKSTPSLDNIVDVLNKYPDMRLVISGHTDNIGNPEKNLILSKQRAESIKAYLIVNGIKESRLETSGFGQVEPIATNLTIGGRIKNRRVEIRPQYF